MTITSTTFVSRDTQVRRKPLVTPFLVILAAVFLFCIPLSGATLPFSGLQHPATSTTVLALCLAISMGLHEIANQRRFRVTRLTSWLVLSLVLCLFPVFYQHSSLTGSLASVAISSGGLLLLVAFQQFSFNHNQRQLLLWLPLLSALLVGLMLLVPAADAFLPGITFSIPFPVLDNTLSQTLLMTGLVLSGYLLARTRAYKQPLVFNHIVLLATPAILLPALLSIRQPAVIGLVIVMILLCQRFLYRYAPRIHHGLWNLAMMGGFSLAWLAGWIPSAALLAQWFTGTEHAALAQSWTMIKSVPFQGVGLGQFDVAYLLFGATMPVIASPPDSFPSWMVKWLAEGGLAHWFSVGIVLVCVARRLVRAPDSTRMILTAMLLPVLAALVTTPFIADSLPLWLLAVLLLYWLDNLSARYIRKPVIARRLFHTASTGLAITATLLVFTSVYLGEQALNTYRLENHKLAQYRYHPVWSERFDLVIAERGFLASVSEGDKAAQHAYLVSRVKHLLRHPTAEGYQQVADIALMIGRDSQAADILSEAEYLFPGYPFQPSTDHREAIR